jgi:Zn-finger nucleic acid-binding protein
MAAEILHCPACGAAASSESTRCQYCGGALATVACPSCFGMMFAGAKFCSHCGASAARTEVAGGDKQLCPRCQAALKTVMVGANNLSECFQCQGLWVDVATLQQICVDREKQAAVLGMPAPPPEPVEVEKNIRYVPCPVCHQLMNRVNFAHCSSVIVDVCKAHGTWFDKDELRRTVEFIRAGGLEKSRERQLAAMEEERQRLAAASNASLLPDQETAAITPHLRASDALTAIDLIGDVLDWLK